MNYAIPVGLIDLIRQSRHILLASHVNADGDAYGSVLGMKLMLDALGKRTHVAMHDPVLDEFLYLPDAAAIRGPREVGADYDLIISVDASSIDRLGDVYHEGKLAGIPLAVVDHHITNTYFGTVNWVEPTCAATCQMLAYLADALGVRLSPELAECLLTGVITDTLCFRTTNTTPAVLEVAMHLQEAGANLAAIVQQTLNRMPYSTLRLWALVLPGAQLEDGVIWAVVRRTQVTGGRDAKRRIQAQLDLCDDRRGRHLRRLYRENRQNRQVGSRMQFQSQAWIQRRRAGALVWRRRPPGCERLHDCGCAGRGSSPGRAGTQGDSAEAGGQTGRHHGSPSLVTLEQRAFACRTQPVGRPADRRQARSISVHLACPQPASHP